MGFVKFARVFRFIGLFLGLNVLAIGLLLLAINNGFFKEAIEQTAEANGMTVEELTQAYTGQAWLFTIAGAGLIIFGIICFIVFGVNKYKLDYEDSSSYSSGYSGNYSSSSSSRSSNYSNSSSSNSRNTSQTSSTPIKLSTTSSGGFYGKGLIDDYPVNKKLTDLIFFDSVFKDKKARTIKEVWESLDGGDYLTEGASFEFKSVKGEITGYYSRSGGNDPKHSDVYVTIYSLTSMNKKVINVFYESYMYMVVDGIRVEFDIDNGDGTLSVARGKDSSGHDKYAKVFEFSVFASEMRDVYSLVTDPNNLIPLVELIADYGYYPPIRDLLEDVSFVDEGPDYSRENFYDLKEKFIEGLE